MKHNVSLTRRQFVGQISFLAGIAAALPCLPGLTLARATLRGSPAEIAPTAPAMTPDPVVSFHIDQPYLDKSGTATPYVPPAGTRSGQSVSELSDAQYLSRYMYF